MTHQTTPRFWESYNALPEEVQRLADKNYDLLVENVEHPSLELKRIGRFWSVRVGLHYRALGLPEGEGIVWFWIGAHAEYDRLIRR
ncbi:hypothetical protein [Armatimonas sp.]|uniref:ParE family toxin-like protein n=1 Tax=Armatimonas sp. TaxID=1872638 RepID=UPI00286B30D2|nr:hypothetical protein [Armatimonas sp.]